MEVSVDLAAGQIGVNRSDARGVGPLLDRPGANTLDLESMRAVFVPRALLCLCSLFFFSFLFFVSLMAEGKDYGEDCECS